MRQHVSLTNQRQFNERHVGKFFGDARQDGVALFSSVRPAFVVLVGEVDALVDHMTVKVAFDVRQRRECRRDGVDEPIHMAFVQPKHQHDIDIWNHTGRLGRVVSQTAHHCML